MNHTLELLSQIKFYSPGLNEIVSGMITLILLVISGLISASEVAYFSLEPETLHKLEESDKKADKRILQLLETPQRLLAGILVGNNFANVAIILILTYITNSLLDFSAVPWLLFLFQTIFITFILLLFGEIIPKIYASMHPLKTAYFTCNLQFVLQKIFSVLIKWLVNSTSIVNRKMARHNHSNISRDELSQALELTSDKNADDKEILEGIINFGNIKAVDIMTSRVDMFMVDLKYNFKQLLQAVIESGYSRIPVYSSNRDNVKGVLYIKDMLAHLDKPATFRWQSLIRQAYYIPETKMIDDLLSEFQKNRVHLAIVVDEYGGTSGLITLEDILEEIVGDIGDEYDEDEKQYTKISEHVFIFEAKILLNDFFKIEEIDEEDFVKISEEVETLAGLILEIKGEIPSRGERIEYDRYVFEILAVDKRRILKVKLHIKEEED